ncbi:hypothetical protein IWW47_000477 [Coemansia sp. RSA 2052]|nr:hypothetical protein IWW47_000477 [Coemansia sp. RSA 2052]
MSYPYADDVLFRGNSATLVRLDIAIDRDTVIMLSGKRVFGSKYKGLQVSIGENSDYVPEPDLCQFMSNLVSSARSLRLVYKLPVNSLIAAAQYSQGFKHLQEFSAAWCEMSVFDFLRLLQLLPALIRVKCGIVEMGAELEHVASDDLPDYVASTYCGIGKCLQAWHITSYRSSLHTNIAEYGMLLALVCPNFGHVKLIEDIVPYYHASIADALRSGPYSKYASQISRLYTTTY